MNLDTHLLDVIVCPACRQSLAVDEAAAGAGLRRVRPGLPGARRHPGAAGRRGPQAAHERTPRPGRALDDLRRRTPRRRGGTRRADVRLRHLAEGGARVRREAVGLGRGRGRGGRRCSPTASRGPWSLPGPTPGCCARCSSRSARCRSSPGPGPACPGGPAAWTWSWCSPPRGATTATAGAVAEAVRRGCQLVVAAPRGSLVAEHAQGRYVTLLPTETGDQLAVAVVVLDLLDRVHLGPRTDPDVVADALDEVAVSCGPHRDLAVNPAKILAIGIADSNPIFWGGTVLAARAGRRIAESIRRATGRTALAADAEHLLPVLEATAPADVFADPFADGGPERRPALVVLDDGTADPAARGDARPARAGGAGPRRPGRDDLLGGRRRRGPLRRDALHRDVRRGLPAARPRRLSRAGRARRYPHAMATEGGTKAVVAALLANTGIALTKFLAFALTASSSMLAEAIHSWPTPATSCCCSSVGGRRARRPTPEHPFGYGRERYIYSFIVAIVLFSVGGLFALYEAYHKFHEVHEHPGDHGPSSTAAGGGCRSCVLVVAIVMESFSFRTAIREANKVRGERVLGPVHPPRQGARAAGHPARGLRRADRPDLRPARRRAGADHRATDLRRASAPP